METIEIAEPLEEEGSAPSFYMSEKDLDFLYEAVHDGGALSMAFVKDGQIVVAEHIPENYPVWTVCLIKPKTVPKALRSLLNNCWDITLRGVKHKEVREKLGIPEDVYAEVEDRIVNHRPDIFGTEEESDYPDDMVYRIMEKSKNAAMNGEPQED